MKRIESMSSVLMPRISESVLNPMKRIESIVVKEGFTDMCLMESNEKN